ncbi:flagellar biogenesis protein [Erythrobacter insulae]|uniref:Flagellar biogenesis protein n=1 Tax=Erythrobacter insulae TaxID=2584124 RepID=A0A547PA93_9SPHN|nr:flagellar biogenesis protein [Erythrobacter insulae]TRD11056.1 flagellar biogenesis protein [Erythrobacter insulae]
MMVEYLLRLTLLLPILGLLIWGSLRLTKYLQNRLNSADGQAQSVQLVQTSLIAPGLKLAVVRFHGREILIGCSRQGLVRLGEADLPAALPDDVRGQD